MILSQNYGFKALYLKSIDLVSSYFFFYKTIDFLCAISTPITKIKF